MNNKILKLSLPILTTTALAAVVTTNVFAWPTSTPIVNCSGVHWEMQNDTKVNHLFTGKVFQPVTITQTADVVPNKWGILDAKFTNLTGKVHVKASISMGGDTRNLDKDLDCGQATPSPSPTPKASPSPTPKPSPSPSPTPTPSVVPSPSATPSATPTTNIIINNNNEQSQDQHQNQNQSQVLGATTPKELPATGVGVLGMTGMFSAAPIGVVLSRFGKGRLAKKKEDLVEFASAKFDERNSQ